MAKKLNLWIAVLIVVVLLVAAVLITNKITGRAILESCNKTIVLKELQSRKFVLGDQVHTISMGRISFKDTQIVFDGFIKSVEKNGHYRIGNVSVYVKDLVPDTIEAPHMIPLGKATFELTCASEEETTKSLTYEDILNMLNKCIITSKTFSNGSGNCDFECSNILSAQGKKSVCIYAESFEDNLANIENLSGYEVVGCSSQSDKNIRCICCFP